MEVFLVIRRHKTSIFAQAKESSTVLDLKLILESILHRPPPEQRLYMDGRVLEDDHTLADCGISGQTALPHSPATIGLALLTGEAFESLSIEPYSSPAGLPYGVME